MKVDFFSDFLLCFRSYSFRIIRAVLKERIQEIFDFTKSESPYRKANKGWINQDIFLDLSASSNTFKQRKEVAKVTFLWSPINRLFSNIFLILIICSILVFTTLSFAKGRFNINLFNTSLVKDIKIVEDDKVLNKSLLDISDNISSEKDQNSDFNELDKLNNLNSLADDEIISDQIIINNEVDKQDRESMIIESNKDIKIMKNKKSKSNFF